MYFTRKKTTLHTTLFHLDDMTVEQKHNHLLEIYKLSADSLNTILQPKNPNPIHFIIPQIFGASRSDELMFTTNKSHILSDVFGMIDNHNPGALFPKTVMDNLFSEEARLGIKEYINTTGLIGKSIFRRPKQVELMKSGDRYDRTLVLQNQSISHGVRLDGIIRRAPHNWDKHMKKYCVSNNYKHAMNTETEIDKSDERTLIDRLSNKVDHPVKKSVVPENRYPNTLLTIDYTLSLSELGDFVVLLYKMFKRDFSRYDYAAEGMESYYSSLYSTLSSLLQSSSGEIDIITKICERLGITDEVIKGNLLRYVQKRSQSVYEDSIRQSNSFQLSKEKLILDSETIINPSNTFISITFFIYLILNKNLLNKPDQIVSYSHDMTRVNNLHGRAGSYTTNCPVDNYKHDSYVTTINTIILPTHLTSLVLKSKMSSLQTMQQYMEVPNTDLLTTQYNNTYIKFKDDFIFYEDSKVAGITNMLSSWINIRFDKNIQVSYFPDFPSQYPLSLYAYRTTYNRTFEKYFKETLFEYLGIEIDYSKPISTYTKTIDEIFTSLVVLNTDTEVLIPKEFKDYLYTWLIVLYLQNNILFKYKPLNTVKKRISEFMSNMDFPEEMRGQWRSEFMNNHWDYYRNYTYVLNIYPMLLEVIYTMLQKSTPEELLESLKTNILPSVEQESKVIISSISKLFKIDEFVLSWATKPLEARNEIRNVENNSSHSPFHALEVTLFNQFIVNLKSIALKSLTNNDYDFLLKHILIGIKSYSFFTSLRSCSYGFLSGSEPQSYISHNFKALTHPFTEDYQSNDVFELNQVMTQYIKKYPKTNITQPANLTIDKLLDWYKDIHLTFDIETF